MPFAFNVKNIAMDEVIHKMIKSYSAEIGQSMFQIANTALSDYLKKELGEERYQAFYNRVSQTEEREDSKTQKAA